MSIFGYILFVGLVMTFVTAIVNFMEKDNKKKWTIPCLILTGICLYVGICGGLYEITYHM